MVKSFSVAWLAQSDCVQAQVPPGELRRHLPCSVQPTPPTSYHKVQLQPKLKSSRPELRTTETLKEKEDQFSPQTPRNCSSPSSSENSGYSSGYESEAAVSECPSEEVLEAEKDSQRRVRTKFTPEQIDRLEKIFSKHKYLDAGERVKTALKLSLSETQVRTWFQNRRMKLKREVQEIRGEFLVPTLAPVMFPGVQRPGLSPLMINPMSLQQNHIMSLQQNHQQNHIMSPMNHIISPMSLKQNHMVSPLSLQQNHIINPASFQQNHQQNHIMNLQQNHQNLVLHSQLYY